MERRVIESIVHNLVRDNREHDSIMLDGIALYVCRANRKVIRETIDNKMFDFEALFAQGTYVLEHLKRPEYEEKLGILCQNFALTAEVLLDYVQTKLPRFYAQQGCITPGASRFMLDWLHPAAGETVYNPFGGDPYAPIDRHDTFFISDIINQKENRYTQLVLAAHGSFNLHCRINNPLMRPEYEDAHYRHIYIPALPFGIRIAGMGRKIEENFVLRMLDVLAPGGNMVVVLPIHSLSSDLYFEFRKTLIERGYLRVVALLGPKAVYATTNVKTAIFFIQKSDSNSDSFLFANATSVETKSVADYLNLIDQISFGNADICTRIQYSDIWGSSNLAIRDKSFLNERIDRPGFKFVKLSEILAPYRKSVEVDSEDLLPRLSGKDMHLQLPDYKIFFDDLPLEHLQGRFTRITEGVFCFHSITQNYLWCDGDDAVPVYCNGDIYTFRIKDKRISPEYLCFVLSEEDVQADIKSRIGESVLPRVSRSSFLDVEIPIPDVDREVLFLQEEMHFISESKNRLAQKEKEAHKESLEDIKDDIEDKIHLLGPYNFDVQSGINRILRKLQKGEKLDASTRIFKDSDIRLDSYLENLLSKSQSAGYITASIGGSIFEAVDRPLDSFLFLQEYLAYLQADDAYDGIQFRLMPIPEPFPLMITSRALRLALDTIVRNAVMHGFADSFYGEKRIAIRIAKDKLPGMAVISVANNGLPAAEGFSEDTYERKFGKCGTTAHTGRGGFFVSNAMHFYKGFVTISTQDKNWPFIVNLHIQVSHE